MAITDTCGPHCGIRANAEDTLAREGHCGCGNCHDGPAPPGGVIRNRNQDVYSQPAGLDGKPLHGTPMCASWHQRCGDYRPWQQGRHDLAAHDVTTPVPDVNPWT